MPDFKKNFILFGIILLLTACSQVLETVSLEIAASDKRSQEEFTVVEKTLTLSEAKSINSSPFVRRLIKTGIGNEARIILETDAIRSNFPTKKPAAEYKVGLGDTLAFIKLIESSSVSEGSSKIWPVSTTDEPYVLGIGDQIALIQVNEESSSPSKLSNKNNGNSGEENIRALAALEGLASEKDVVQTTGRIGSDGSVLLLEVGRIEALGKTITDLRSEVRNILIRNGISPKFQLEITAFNSQKAYLTINSSSTEEDKNLTTSIGRVIQLTDQPLTLREILSKSGVTTKPHAPTRVYLQRSKLTYSFELQDIYAATAKEINLKDRDHIFVDDSISSVFKSEATVGSDGKILLPSVGKVKVLGKSIREIENQIKQISEIKSNFWSDFQIQVIEFKSQKVVVSIPKQEGTTEISSKVISLTDKQLRLDELLTENGVTIQKNKLTKVHLQRGKEQSSFLLSDLLVDPTNTIFLQPGDRIRIERLTYKNNKVFILGSGLEPKIFNIKPENRETLADALLTKNGPFASKSAKRSDTYLLRGREPVIAYHLDALSPSRILVAEATELRPNDIIFVTEQPIISFNRTLQTLFPLRILLRDIDNQNIP